MDFRLVPEQDPRVIARALRAYLDAGRYQDVRMTVLWEAVPVRSPLDAPFVRRIAPAGGAAVPRVRGGDGRRPA